jgi:hypothetical protein
MSWTCSMPGHGDEKSIKNFGWKPEGKKPLERPSCR